MTDVEPPTLEQRAPTAEFVHKLMGNAGAPSSMAVALAAQWLRIAERHPDNPTVAANYADAWLSRQVATRSRG